MRHYKCDIGVVGCGASGLASAVAALERKASVIVLERATVEFSKLSP
jgi:succinate dehydrogenase/fumarate reductase flavoprotein subunit